MHFKMSKENVEIAKDWVALKLSKSLDTFKKCFLFYGLGIMLKNFDYKTWVQIISLVLTFVTFGKLLKLYVSVSFSIDWQW